MMKATIRLLLLITFFGITASGLKSQTLHAFIAGDTEDVDIGAGVNEDLNNMEGLVKAIGKSIGMKTEIIFFTPENGFSKNRLTSIDIERAIDSKVVNENDIIVFHYSGHGLASETDIDGFPRMALSDGLFPLTKVRDIIKRKRARFSLVTGDLCNSFPDTKTIFRGKGFNSIFQAKDYNEAYETLFLGVTGEITVCSSNRGDLSYTSKRGGYFTNAFIEALNTITQSNITSVSWDKVFEQTGEIEFERIARRPFYEINTEVYEYSPNEDNNTFEDIDLEPHKILLMIANNELPQMERVRMQARVLDQVFENSNAKVEIVGSDRKTLLKRVTSRDYISRICTVQSLSNIEIVDQETGPNGKFIYLKVTEIYKP